MKLIPKGIKDIDKIIVAISNDIALEHGMLKEEDKEIILGRRLICSTCPFMSKNAVQSKEYFDLINGHYSTDREEDHCSMCGCPTKIRTAAFTKNCGMEAWNIDHPNNQKELKWKAVHGIKISDLLVMLAYYLKEGLSRVDIIVKDNTIYLKPNEPSDKPRRDKPSNGSIGDLKDHI
jgi:hypothetical protein